MTQLTIVENIQAVTTFDQEKVNDYLKKLRDHEKSIVGDITTEYGRKEIASRAFAIAKAKNDIDRAANKLKEQAQNKVKSVNAERNRIWDEMEAIQKDVRAPLTEWEQKEETRVNTLKAAIDKIVAAVNFEGQPTTADIKARIDSLSIEPDDWQEFKKRAEFEKEKALEILNHRYAASQKHDAEQLELAALRAAEVSRLQKERDEQIAKDAADKARIAAEALAKQEAERQANLAEQARLDVVRQKEAAEAATKKAEADKLAAIKKADDDRIAAEKKAADDTAKAVQNEKDRVAREKAAEDKAAADREADKKHKAKINNEVLSAIIEAMRDHPADDLGNTDNAAKAVVVAIASGKIPHVKITY